MVGNFYTWAAEHYDFRRDDSGHHRICKRCGMDVWHLTKHAVNVHGDAIAIMPTTEAHLAAGMDSDDAGRLTTSGVSPKQPNRTTEIAL
jgi:hypothetical protein